jgi:hypothetical protein
MPGIFDGSAGVQKATSTQSGFRANAGLREIDPKIRKGGQYKATKSPEMCLQIGQVDSI